MKNTSKFYIYRNINDDSILSIEMKFIDFVKEVVGYERGISIEISAYTRDYSDYRDLDYALTRFSYPFPISDGKIIWKSTSSITKDHNVDMKDLKKFCERIVKLKIFE